MAKTIDVQRLKNRSADAAFYKRYDLKNRFFILKTKQCFVFYSIKLLKTYIL